MILEPMFGKVFIKRAAAPSQQSTIWVAKPLPEDEGIVVHAGTSEVVKKGDYVKFEQRGACEIQFNNEFVVSISDDQISAIIT